MHAANHCQEFATFSSKRNSRYRRSFRNSMVESRLSVLETVEPQPDIEAVVLLSLVLNVHRHLIVPSENLDGGMRNTNVHRVEQFSLTIRHGSYVDRNLRFDTTDNSHRDESLSLSSLRLSAIVRSWGNSTCLLHLTGLANCNLVKRTDLVKHLRKANKRIFNW